MRKVLVRQERRAKVIELLGGRCSVCGTQDHRLLQIDHVNSDGYLDTNGSKLIERIILGKRGVSDLRLLCANDHVLVTYGVK